MRVSSETILNLTTRGRRSGKPRLIEIWFVTASGKWYVVAEMRERAGWVKNLRAWPEVAFSIGIRGHEQRELATTRATARPLDPGDEQVLGAKVRAAMDAKYGWSDGLIVELTPAASPPSSG